MIGDMIDGAIVVLAGLKARLARRAATEAPAPVPVPALPPADAPVRAVGDGVIVLRLTEREAEAVAEACEGTRVTGAAVMIASGTCMCPACAPLRTAARQAVETARLANDVGRRLKALGIDRLAEQCAAVPVPTDGGRRHG